MLYELSRIKKVRKQLGLTQTELANKAGVSQSIITKIERGTIEPSYSIARKIFAILDEEMTAAHKEVKAKDIYTKKVASIKPEDTISHVISLMKKYAISQIPVVHNNSIVGSITEETFIKNYDKVHNKNMLVSQIMDEPFPTIPEDTPVTIVREILKAYTAVIVLKNGKPVGIISKADLLKKL